ncbi:MAG TPA: M56 family metallopeptidase [Sphingomicrobium sp.]|jgi:beta-lactamase regulating signal transducer with metallopeptidase domain|nr:M56 family metallopeptidase [Sphingomicrobium sp.]
MTDWLLHTLVATSALMLLALIVREPVRTWFGSRVTYGLWLIPAARFFMPTLTQTVERVVPAPAAGEPIAAAVATQSEPSLTVGGWPSALIIIWLAVAAALFLTRVIAFQRDRRAMLETSAGNSRLGAVRFVRTDEVRSPVALGIFRPIIAVPCDFERIYGKRERRLVLEHELAHHRSGDLVANLFAFVLLCLQWFNPLAWAAHAAFRFDQEAACDARVLDKAPPADRANYGRAIAKAASGRALLFASALDRPTSLQRRLKSMLRTSTPTRRIAGTILIVTAVVAALPLTAGRAIAYVDVPAPEAPVPVAHALPADASAAAVGPAKAAPVGHSARPARHAEFDGKLSIDDDMVTIDGKTKRWEDLTPAEKAKVESAVAKARASLANAHIDEAKVVSDLANLPDKARMEQIQRDLAGTQAKVAESMRRIDEEMAKARASGRSPDALDSAIREKLQLAQTVDVAEAARALANIDRNKIAADVAGAGQAMEKAKAELERIQARIDADRRQ